MNSMSDFEYLKTTTPMLSGVFKTLTPEQQQLALEYIKLLKVEETKITTRTGKKENPILTRTVQDYLNNHSVCDATRELDGMWVPTSVAMIAICATITDVVSRLVITNSLSQVPGVSASSLQILKDDPTGESQ